jgi:hypothetical protein
MSHQPDSNQKSSVQPKIPSAFDHECERPACADIQQMFHQQQQQQMMLNASPPPKGKSIDTGSKNTVQNSDTRTTSAVVTNETQGDKSECPVDSRTLGRASWTLLHSMVRPSSVIVVLPSVGTGKIG